MEVVWGMNKFKIIKMMVKEKKYRWRYTYLLPYAFGCRDVPHFIAKYIRKCNAVELEENHLLPLKLNTYDGSGQAVHPDLVEYNGKLWMVCTPYPYAIETYENPSVYFGNTIYDMEPVPNNPLCFQENRLKGNHISDPCIYIDGGTINILFRDTINICGKVTQKLYVMSSIDGVCWGDKKLVFESETESYISPAILKYKDLFFMYYIQLGSSNNGGDIHRVILNDKYEVIEECVVKCNNLPDNMVVWHIGLNFEDKCSKQSFSEANGINGVFVLRDVSDTNKYALYWAHSDNVYSEWNIQSEIVIPEYLSKHVNNVYKSAIIPNTGEILLSYCDNCYRWNFAILPGLKQDDINEFKESFKVFTRVFRKSMTWERFCYKHIKNPNLLNTYFYQIKDENSVIGTNCFNGVRGICGKEHVLIAQSCDTAVVPEARGKGVFIQMISEAEEKLCQENVDVMIGFPNNNSYHGFIKMGWKHIGNYIPWVNVHKPIDVLLDKVLHVKKHYVTEGKVVLHDNVISAGISDGSIEKTCPFSDSDYLVINRNGNLKIERTTDYYKWKCDNNQQCYYYVLRGNRKLFYTIFYINEKGRIFVVDYFSSDHEERFKMLCLRQFISDVKDMGNTFVFTMVKESSMEERILKHCGFERGDKKPFGFPVARMIVHNLKQDISIETMTFDKWDISPLDVDTMIS